MNFLLREIKNEQAWWQIILILKAIENNMMKDNNSNNTSQIILTSFTCRNPSFSNFIVCADHDRIQYLFYFYRLSYK